MSDSKQPQEEVVKQLPPDTTPPSFTGAVATDEGLAKQRRTGRGRWTGALIALMLLAVLLIWLLF